MLSLPYLLPHSCSSVAKLGYIVDHNCFMVHQKSFLKGQMDGFAEFIPHFQFYFGLSFIGLCRKWDSHMYFWTLSFNIGNFVALFLNVHIFQAIFEICFTVLKLKHFCRKFPLKKAHLCTQFEWRTVLQNMEK